MSFLHDTLPDPTAFTVANIEIGWYGLFLAFGAFSGYVLTVFLAKQRKMPIDKLTDLLLVTTLFGFIGARLYHVLNEPVYYWDHPGEILQVWNGGLAIHGGILVGLLVLYYGAKRLQTPLLRLTDLLAPGVLLGLSIGRWGNYFNQELFGRPTDLPWGIPVAESLRPLAYEFATHFHPVFLYESLIDLLGAIFLFLLLWIAHKSTVGRPMGLTTAYFFVIYGLGRLTAELFRFDPTPDIFGLRLPLLVSAIAVLLGLWILIRIRQGRYPLPVRPNNSTLKSDANPRPDYPTSH